MICLPISSLCSYFRIHRHIKVTRLRREPTLHVVAAIGKYPARTKASLLVYYIISLPDAATLTIGKHYQKHCQTC